MAKFVLTAAQAVLGRQYRNGDVVDLNAAEHRIGGQLRRRRVPHRQLAVQSGVRGERADGAGGKVIEVPGSGDLNKGGQAAVNSVSCPSAGNCAGAGFYTAGSRYTQAFVVSERDGTGGKAIEVPGSGDLNKGGQAAANSVSSADPRTTMRYDNSRKLHQMGEPDTSFRGLAA